jgi:hypothetical protein
MSKFLLPSRPGKGQNKVRDTSTADNLGAQHARHPVACALAEYILCYPRSKLRRGFFMPSCRSKRPPTGPPVQAGRVDKVPLPDGPFPRLLLLLLRNVVAADLRRAAIWVEEMPKLSISTAHTPCVTFDARPLQ